LDKELILLEEGAEHCQELDKAVEEKGKNPA
jgi:hypothetical protein